MTAYALEKPAKTVEISRAVIYARVSSQKQVEEGNGLTSQAARCESFASARGFEIEKIFYEEGISGSMIDRPAMQAMLSFLNAHASEASPIAVIIDDISRLARGVLAHAELRTAITLAGGVLKSPSIKFGDDADSQLVEYLLATVSQHQRAKNAEQVRNRMKARWMAGYCTWNPGMGYKFEEVSGHGKMIVPDEPVASLIRESFEGLASGRFKGAAEVQRFLERHPDGPTSPAGKVSPAKVHTMLRRELYAGYLSVKSAGIYMLPGKHEPLISYEVWQRVQDILNDKSKPIIRTNVIEDFVLRGHIECSSCGGGMTAAWTKGRNKSYPYYLCQSRKCDLKGKSFSRDKLETEFYEIIKTLRPAPAIFHMAADMFRRFWNARSEKSELLKKNLSSETAYIDRKIDTLTERLLGTESPALISAYEGQIKKLELKKIGMIEKAKAGIEPQKPFDEMFKTAMTFLANPCRIWENGNYEHKRLLLRLAFPERIIYSPEKGYRTAKIAMPFKALGQFCKGKIEMVEGVGFEPTYAKRSDLQSDGFNHSPTPPNRAMLKKISHWNRRSCSILGSVQGCNTLLSGLF